MKHLRRHSSYLFLIILLASGCKDRDHGNVPISNDVPRAIDGQLSQQEWLASAYFDITPLHELLLVQNNTHLYIGIRSSDSVARYIDLYFESTDIGLLNLHASFAEGERQLVDQWNDTIPSWHWGPFPDWQANTVRSISDNEDIPFKQSLEPYEGFEFKIPLTKLNSTRLHLLIEIRDFLGQTKDIVFPTSGKRYLPETWFELKL